MPSKRTLRGFEITRNSGLIADHVIDFTAALRPGDQLSSVSYSMNDDAAISIDSCEVNSQPLNIEGEEATLIDANKAIVMWISGGASSQVDQITVNAVTQLGRTHSIICDIKSM